MSPMTLLDRTTRLLDRLTDGFRELSPEAAFQPYISALLSRGFQTLGIDRDLKFLVPGEAMQRWLDRRWSAIISEFAFLAGNVVASEDVVIECASGYGIRSIALAALAGPNGRLIGFESQRRCQEILRENTRINGLPNITAEAMVLGDEEGVAVLHEDHLGQATVCYDCTRGTPDAQCRRDASGSFEVPMVTLDGYLEQKHIVPDVLVLDAGGNEREILRGAKTLLGRFPKLWIAIDPEAPSRHRCSLAELGQILERSHYDWSVISRTKTPPNPHKPIPMIAGPSYILGVPRPVRYAVSASRAVGTHPTGTPLESYSR
jgi:FkbM family methyltransferase